MPAGTGRLDGRPSVLVATEPWSPNPDRATWLLNPLGAGLPSMRSGRAFSVLMS
ncbi:hypothetical protein [Kitasatospora sp. MY 5-36]|uniref:hypothetical protein n=1 Tax=Kitasatospora sp. MY 5-36 TaxID=1678027 RepID=UPI00131CE294|nr:hypothetical protein [Kitasatospora sp. MY 5-36]